MGGGDPGCSRGALDGVGGWGGGLQARSGNAALQAREGGAGFVALDQTDVGRAASTHFWLEGGAPGSTAGRLEASCAKATTDPLKPDQRR
jgi:hypothetical protein